MRNVDKFLVAIVVGVIALVIIALSIALRQPEATYVSDDTPDGVVQNYLLALQKEDYTRAWGYLAPSLEGYPETVEAFVDDVMANPWMFGPEAEAGTLDVEPASITGDRAVVTLRESRFQQRGLFESNQFTSRFRMELARENGDWRLIDGDDYWFECWHEPAACERRPLRAPDN